MFWVDKNKDEESADRVHEFGRWLAEDRHGNNSWLTKVCTWIDSKRSRKIKIRIDRYDTWSMDHTLSLIILPMLKQLKATKHGSPFVNDEDVPKHLRSTAAPPRENEWDTDDNHHLRWDWVMDEMIWAFEQNLNEDDDAFYDKYEENEPIDPPLTFNVIQKDGTVREKTFKWDTEERRRKRGKYNNEKRKAFDERKSNAFRLFGKYYQGLWD